MNSVMPCLVLRQRLELAEIQPHAQCSLSLNLHSCVRVNDESPQSIN